MTESKLSAVFEFTKAGYLKAILLSAENESDQATLERALDRLFKPGHLSWVRRLFKR